jgi:hypothetical protein
MLSIIVFMSLVVECYELDQVSVEMACDGIEALREISEEYKVTKSGSNSYDFIAAAKSHLAISPLKWKFRHLRGHQKKAKTEFGIIWERLNDDCDKVAGAFREWCERQHTPNYSLTLPKEPWAEWRGADKWQPI